MNAIERSAANSALISAVLTLILSLACGKLLGSEPRSFGPSAGGSS